MTDYIDRGKAIKAITSKYDEVLSVADAIEILDRIQKVELAPVVHGEWIWDKDGMDWGLGAWRCSECRNKPETWWEADPGNPYRCSGSHYCNNCGAKMDKVNSNG